MTIRKVAIFPIDNNPDTNQWPIDPTEALFSHGGAEFTQALGPAEIELIKRVNSGDVVPVEQKIKWAVRNIVGGIYYAKEQQNGVDLPPWWWASVIMGSGVNKTNYVNTLEYAKGKARIETIPLLADYSAYSVETHRHLFHRIFVTNKSGCWDSPAGLFWMPLFDGRWRKLPALKYTGMWVKTSYLGAEVTSIPPIEPPTEPPPETNSLYIVLRRTVIRQRPNGNAPKVGLAFVGEVYAIDPIGNWGKTSRGYINMDDVRPAQKGNVP